METRIYKASYQGDILKFNKLFKQIKREELKQEILNKSLNFTCTNGHQHMVKYLISLGADVNYNQEEPLFNALVNSRFELVKYLIQKGANIYAREEAFRKHLIHFEYFELFDLVI